MEKHICVHGHFYQPPRENPWLETVEAQASAHPYHDWNERITAESYATNAASRILDPEGRIERITSNYTRMSFNFGPTLLAWMEEAAPGVHEQIVEADRESRERFGGHGSALAQAYNHMIMPLADRRDKETQVLWGIRDFEHRFGRFPEGMWLPETAVDLETLEIMAEQGILFTILAQHQARRVREKGAKSWTDVEGGSIDPTMAYSALLPSGRSLALFFYDGPISQAVAFENLLSSGEKMVSRLEQGFSDERTWPQLVHIATDGESYGHHHRQGDMALAYALETLEERGEAALTNYGWFLERHPPTHEVEIVEDSSWSCIHGIERWRSDCGCSSGGHPGWNQAWRAPLRDALDWLHDLLAMSFEKRAASLLGDPWAARNDYVDVVLDRSDASVKRFLDRHAARELNGHERTEALELLEMERHAMLMYTSCGWFFDELSGIETVQVIEYAGRAVQLCEAVTGDDLEPAFLERLGRARSNLPDPPDGRGIYERWIKPAMLNLRRVVAHYAASSLFEGYEKETEIYCFSVRSEDDSESAAGRSRLTTGRATVSSRITRESGTFQYALFHLGDQNLLCGVAPFSGEEDYLAMIRGVTDAFEHADFSRVVLEIEQRFGPATYSLKSLFRDQQIQVTQQVLDAVLSDAEASHRQIFEIHAPLMRFLSDSAFPQPRVFAIAAEFVLNTDLQRRLSVEEPDPEAVDTLLQEVRQLGVVLDKDTLEFALRRNLERMSRALREAPGDLDRLQRLRTWTDIVHRVPFDVNLFEVQNIGWGLTRDVYPGLAERADSGDREAAAAADHYRVLAEELFHFQPLRGTP
jgi:alpha-amylase/alpha-mannosidase (GH57 family)